MECRKGVSLIRILIQYMFLCGFTACLIAVSFWIGLNLLVNKGVAYPANAGERMAAEAAERHRQRNRKAMDRAAYLETAEQRRVEARLRRAKGESLRQIAMALGVSHEAIRKMLKA